MSKILQQATDIVKSKQTPLNKRIIRCIKSSSWDYSPTGELYYWGCGAAELYCKLGVSPQKFYPAIKKMIDNNEVIDKGGFYTVPSRGDKATVGELDSLLKTRAKTATDKSQK